MLTEIHDEHQQDEVQVCDSGDGSSTKCMLGENQDGGVGRHTALPCTTRTDRESNSKGDQHQENRK